MTHTDMLNNRKIIPLDQDWTFKKGMDIAGFDHRIDDGDWEVVHLPHDFSIFGPFLEDNPSGPRGGYAPAGIGWYRQHLHGEDFKGKRVMIVFDGIYMNSSIFLNGIRVGKHAYGYTSLVYDLTPYLDCEGDNLLAVKVDTSLQPGSRWYSGAGIYRHVRLIVTEQVHVAPWGTYITTPEVTKEMARVHVETSIVNASKSDSYMVLKTEIIDAAHEQVAEASTETTIPSGETGVVHQSLNIECPRLWSVETPYLYGAKTTIYLNGQPMDDYWTTFGVRTMVFSPQKGFLLNGKPLKIKGTCMHHDGGALGAACFDRTFEREIEILKAMGCNAIRTSHNPPAPALLDLCDRLGMLVMDEAFDEYRMGKCPRVFDGETESGTQVRRPIYAYAEYFDEDHEMDLSSMVIRDRNHPSVFMWSIGNEIKEHQWEEGATITEELCQIVKRYDKTRPTVAGIVHFEAADRLGIPDLLDVAGYNYKEYMYASQHIQYPNRVILGSETRSASPFESRGSYEDFIESGLLGKTYEDVMHAKGDVTSLIAIDRYLHAEYSWKVTKALDFVCGLFIWTGFDYIGEPTPFAWPSKSSYFGVIDTCGIPKDAYYMYQSQWTDEPMLHLFPHWNWQGKEGDCIPVWCYTNCERVTLYLNGKSLGEKMVDESDFLHVAWQVAYEPGELKAVAKNNDQVVLEKSICTARAGKRIVLEADRNAIQAGMQDIVYVIAQVVDEDGHLVPHMDDALTFHVEGAGQLIGVDNGSPTNTYPYKGNCVKTVGGKCLGIIQSAPCAGEVKLTVEGEGLQEEKISIQVV